MSLLGLVVVPAAAGVAIAASGSTPNAGNATNTLPNGGVGVSAGAAKGTTTADALQLGGTISVGTSTSVKTRLGGALSRGLGLHDLAVARPDNLPIYSQWDAEAQAKLDEVKAYAEGVYNNMSDDARKAGAEKLNDTLGLDPPLTGDEDWETMAKIAGGAAGVAAFGWIPTGQIWGPIVGAYLGVKLEELINKNLDEIKAWFKGRWSDVETWVKSLDDKIEQATQDAIDYVGSLF